ncbi:hypothetical protein HDU93_005849 [Gonapodya sp. JEL0774]|nr:hypothetical protein HDU93_005849 [Gonapodya sp. JEL0774]
MVGVTRILLQQYMFHQSEALGSLMGTRSRVEREVASTHEERLINLPAVKYPICHGEQCGSGTDYEDNSDDGRSAAVLEPGRQSNHSSLFSQFCAEADVTTFHLRLRAAANEAMGGKADVDMREPEMREEAITLRVGAEIDREGGLVMGGPSIAFGWLHPSDPSVGSLLSRSQSQGQPQSLSQSASQLGSATASISDTRLLAEPGFQRLANFEKFGGGSQRSENGLGDGTGGMAGAGRSNSVGVGRRSISLTLPSDPLPGVDPYAYDPAADPLNDMFAGWMDLDLGEVEREHRIGRERRDKRKKRRREDGSEVEDEDEELDRERERELQPDLFGDLDFFHPAPARRADAKSLPTPPPEEPIAQPRKPTQSRKKVKKATIDDKPDLGHSDLFPKKGAQAEWIGDVHGWQMWEKEKLDAERKAVAEILTKPGISHGANTEIASLWEKHVIGPRKLLMRKNAAKGKGKKVGELGAGADVSISNIMDLDLVMNLDMDVPVQFSDRDIEVEVPRGKKKDGSSMGLSPAVWRRDGSEDGTVQTGRKGETPWSNSIGGDTGWEWGGGKSSLSGGGRGSVLGRVGYSPLFKDGEPGGMLDDLPFDEDDIEMADMARETLKFFNFAQGVLKKARTDVVYFNDLLGPKPTRGDKSNKFHALLSLSTRNMISVKQDEPFGDIEIKIKKVAVAAAPVK